MPRKVHKRVEVADKMVVAAEVEEEEAPEVVGRIGTTATGLSVRYATNMVTLLGNATIDSIQNFQIQIMVSVNNHHHHLSHFTI